MGTYCDQCNTKISSSSTYKPTTCDCYTKLDKDGYLEYAYEGFCRLCWVAQFKDRSVPACQECGVKFQKDKVEID